MGQRVRRLSSPGREEKGEGEGQEERGGETGEGERREERRRQAQLLQIHRELQNVEVILHVPLLLCLFNCISVFICAFFFCLCRTCYIYPSVYLYLGMHSLRNIEQCIPLYFDLLGKSEQSQ